MLSIVAVAVFAYYGGASCPKILKDNKQMLMGVVVGLLLGSFFGVRLEGFAEETAGTEETGGTGETEEPGDKIVFAPLDAIRGLFR